MTCIFDEHGRKFEIVSEGKIQKLCGDGGLFALARTEVSITVNGYTFDFALRVKMPALLYLNGRPAVPNVMYKTFQGDDGYWYGLYFSKLIYTDKKVTLIPSLVRTIETKVVKCLSVL